MASKTQIRRETARILASKGYGRGTFAWPKPGRLAICHATQAKAMEFRLPSGTSLKMVRYLLETVPPVGPERKLDQSLGFTVFPRSREIQHELECFA